MALSPKQNAFVAAYLVCLNASQAALEAGYAPASAAVTGSQLLRNPKVRLLIDEALKRRAERVEVKADDVLRELVRIFSADIGKAYDVNGKLLKLRDMPEEIRRCIVGVKAKEIYGDEGEDLGTLVEVKFADKVRGIELAMKHLGLLVEKHEHSGTVSLEQLVMSSLPEGKK